MKEKRQTIKQQLCAFAPLRLCVINFENNDLK